MGKFSAYKIPLRGLSEGTHTYEYVLDNNYFILVADDDSSDVKRGNVNLFLTVKRISSTFEMNFEFSGVVQVACDRCLDDMPIEIESQNRLFVKFGQEYAEESDEIVVIPEDDGEINIVWFIYEFISLSIPMKHVHAPGKCNKLMSSKLNKHKAVSASGSEDDDDDETEEDVNIISSDDSVETDPRWDALKTLNTTDD